MLENIFRTLTGQNSRDAKNAYQDAADSLNISVPALESLIANYKEIDYAGDYNPNLMRNTAYNKIQADPAAQRAQYQALDRLTQMANQQGLGAQEKLLLAQANQNAAQQEQSQRQALMAANRRRGVSGSGNELAAQLSAIQSAAGQRSMAGAQAQAQAKNRALQALQQSAQLGGQIRGQQYGEDADRASANDAISQFNVSNMNQADLRNINTKQALNEANTGIYNRGEDSRVGAAQQNFNNQATAGQMNYTGQTGMGNYYTGRDRQGRDDFGNVLNTAADIGKAAMMGA